MLNPCPSDNGCENRLQHFSPIVRCSNFKTIPLLTILLRFLFPGFYLCGLIAVCFNYHSRAQAAKTINRKWPFQSVTALAWGILLFWEPFNCGTSFLYPWTLFFENFIPFKHCPTTGFRQEYPQALQELWDLGLRLVTWAETPVAFTTKKSVDGKFFKLWGFNKGPNSITFLFRTALHFSDWIQIRRTRLS